MFKEKRLWSWAEAAEWDSAWFKRREQPLQKSGLYNMRMQLEVVASVLRTDKRPQFNF